jgi:hypothetical protein
VKFGFVSSMSTDDQRSIEVDSSRLLSGRQGKIDSGNSNGYGAISIDDIDIPEHESLAQYYDGADDDNASTRDMSSGKPASATKRSWFGNLVYWLSTSSAEREADRLSAQQLSDRLVRAVWSDSMSEVLRTIQQGASINAPGRLDGKGIGWCRDNHEFRVMAPFEGGVPASPLHFGALFGRQSNLNQCDICINVTMTQCFHVVVLSLFISLAMQLH